MTWAERQTRQQAAVYATLGQDAAWTGIAEPVRVILRDWDSALGQTIVDQVLIRVRNSEVSAPAEGDIVTLSEDERTFEIIAPPLLDRKLNWNCEAGAVLGGG